MFSFLVKKMYDIKSTGIMQQFPVEYFTDKLNDPLSPCIMILPVPHN
jgi:hypothetical protein